jgi:hypothetical protein
MALVGAVRVTSIQEGTPTSLWRHAGAHASVSRREYDRYFEDARHAAALWLADPFQFDEPMTLAALRESSGFRPPQSFRYFDRAQVLQLLDADSEAVITLGLLEHPDVQLALLIEPEEEGTAPAPRGGRAASVGRGVRGFMGRLTGRGTPTIAERSMTAPMDPSSSASAGGGGRRASAVCD